MVEGRRKRAPNPKLPACGNDASDSFLLAAIYTTGTQVRSNCNAIKPRKPWTILTERQGPTSNHCDEPRERNHNQSAAAEPLLYAQEWRTVRDLNPQPFDPERKTDIFDD